MRVGIRCAYDRSDATYAALQVARVAVELGHDVLILPQDGRPATLHPVWDRHLVRGDVTVWDWLRGGLDYAVFTRPVGADVTAFARRKKVKPYLICLWDELGEESLPLLEGFDRVVFPFRRALALVKDLTELTNLSCVPWDVGVPLTRNSYELDPRRVGLIWSLEGSQPLRQEPKFLSVVEHVLARSTNAFFTVTYDELPPHGQKDLKRLVQVADGRLEVQRGLSWDQRQYLYGRHDLTVWPSLTEGLGLVGLTSLHMGTPLLAFDHPVVGEIVKDGSNGILVPCELSYNGLGVPVVRPDYPAFGRRLTDLLRDPSPLTQLRYGAAAGLSDRRERFRTFWGELLDR